MWLSPWSKIIVSWDWSKVDWGTAPAWGAVVVASVAAVFAFLSAKANRKGNQNQQKQIEHQQKQLDRAEEDKRREQASKVAIWLYTKIEEAAYYKGGPIYPVKNTYIRVANTSDVPIYYAVVAVGHGARLLEVVPNGRLAIVPPGGRDIPFNPGVPFWYRAHASILFNDSNGTTWFRSPFGELTEQTRESSDRILSRVLPKEHPLDDAFAWM